VSCDAFVQSMHASNFGQGLQGQLDGPDCNAPDPWHNPDDPDNKVLNPWTMLAVRTTTKISAISPR
jgi:hypothetical protein